MLTEIDAQIFLESQRGCFQTDGFRSFRTFNFEEYEAEGREPFGKLLTFNDETLLPGQSHIFSVAETCRIILLPLVGGIEVALGDSAALQFVDSGEVLSFCALPGEHYNISNPYAEEAINYLQIRIECNETDQLHRLTKFDLSNKNFLLPAHSGREREASVYIGKYDGREEGVFIPDAPNRRIFAFIVEGAFEFQNRLLEKRDGLSIRNANEIEFEALSNDAVILVLEV
ncbi:pirin family protein [Dyadobacter luticola]|uniref:Quercetin 2,3-dioxygenase C-terminal cupin domain-containing protein n=1 Tax=Dyadobacter luticola TaxID=1979387 RepID=A0A5R9KNV0_9BACT|nr:hypothetical protein [Dyadobacter luticola]TLU97847.1 hypothetical protein FEN17_23915 [Dyadobacter luticola]